MAGSDTDRNVILSDLEHEAHKIAEVLTQPKFWWDGDKIYINVEHVCSVWQNAGEYSWRAEVGDSQEYFSLTEAQKESLIKFLRDTGRM